MLSTMEVDTEIPSQRILPDLRGHLVFSLMVSYGFFKEDDDNKRPRKSTTALFNKAFFLKKLIEAENYVQGFLNYKIKDPDIDLLLNVCGTSYANKIMNLDLPDETKNRFYLLKAMKGLLPNKPSLQKRLDSLQVWIDYAKYEI